MTSHDLSGLKQATIDSFEAFFQGREDPAWPLEIFIEVSNLCNLKCAMCGPFSAVNPRRLQSLAEQRRGFFDVAGWPGLESSLAHALYVHAFGYGEPTLHPDFIEILNRLSGFQVMTDFITNGMRLTQDLCDAVVAARVAAVTVSISGATRADYENVYIGGEFETVLSGIRRLAETRARARTRYPRITVNSIAFRHHIASLPAFVDLMAAHGVDIIEVKKLMDDVPAMAGHGAPMRPAEEGQFLVEARARAASHGMAFSAEQYERESEADAPQPIIPLQLIKEYAKSLVQESNSDSPLHSDIDAGRSTEPMEQVLGIRPLSVEHFGTANTFYCLEPYKTLYVRRSGLVKPCCFAANAAPTLGDATRHSGDVIWRGEAFATLRTSIASGSYPKPACEACIRRGSGPKNNVLRERIRDYVAWAREGGPVAFRASLEADLPAPIIIAARQRQRHPPDLRTSLHANPSLASSSPPHATTDIVVPVHNAGAELRACLISLARHTNGPFRLILIDDGSSDTEVRDVFEIVADHAPGAVIVRHNHSQGFVSSINEGLALSTGSYVVILNSDTVVTYRWLAKLVEGAGSRPNAATVTPLTNNGTICSVPSLRNPGGIPAGYDVDTFASLVDARSLREFPEAPTGVGFCMLITRQALDRVGTFDAEAFGRGYGEENDFCQRAIRAGFVNLIADHAFVFHSGGASFGDLSGALIAPHLEIIRRRYPNYDDDVDAFYRDDPLATLRADLASQVRRLAGAPVPRRLRVLHMLHRGGGTEIHARDLAATDDPDVVSYVSSSDGSQLDVDEYAGGVRGRSWTFPLESPLGAAGPLRDEGYRGALTSMCRSLGIDVIHVHHLLGNTLDIPDVAADLGIRYAVTVHDYFMLCPSYTLLDPAGEPCGACIGRRPIAHAEACMQHAGQSAASTSIATRQAEMEKFLNGAARLFAPNARVVDIFAGSFPALRDRIEVVEHGHKWADRIDRTNKQPRQKGRLNVAIIGGLEPHKGLTAVRHLLRANQRKETVFHLYGWTPDAELRSLLDRPRQINGSTLMYHGPYEADAIVERLVADGIDVGLQLAVWEETFSFTLSEFAAAGIPVIAGDLGAQGERVRRCNLGWTVPDPKTPGPILQILEDILDKPETLDRAVAAMRLNLALPDLNAMWTTYAQVYRDLAPEPGVAMNQSADDERLLNRDYVLFLASRSVQHKQPDQSGVEAQLTQANAEISALRERLRSPRHRIADSAAGLLHKIPIVWPIVAKITDAIVRREPPKK